VIRAAVKTTCRDCLVTPRRELERCEVELFDEQLLLNHVVRENVGTVQFAARGQPIQQSGVTETGNPPVLDNLARQDRSSRAALCLSHSDCDGVSCRDHSPAQSDEIHEGKCDGSKGEALG
jgi:hypothetical protein